MGRTSRLGGVVRTGRYGYKIYVKNLMDKSLHQYGIIKEYYRGRNDIAHGRISNEQFLIPNVAQTMETVTGVFPTL
jgi:hypothetical protein